MFLMAPKVGPIRKVIRLAPLGVYGQSKAQGETAIRSILPDHIILRTSWLYGVNGNNFVKTILKLATEKTALRVVADQFGSPTSAADLAKAVMTIAKKISAKEKFDWGTYHYCCKGINDLAWPGRKNYRAVSAVCRTSRPGKWTPLQPLNGQLRQNDRPIPFWIAPASKNTSESIQSPGNKVLNGLSIVSSQRTKSG